MVLYNMITFEEFLSDIFARNYTGTDDDMPDRFEHWIENLDVDELIKLADSYGEIMFTKGKVALAEYISNK